jgi:3-deoxy-D-manno-octulosonate 8-phosphate phosphatase (KDO 8-P phosphatase)
MHLLSRLKLVNTFVFDMDGVLTDGSLLVHEGRWIRRMNIRDGYALQLAVKSGFQVIVISGSNSPEVTARLEKLGIHEVFMNVKNKVELLRKLSASKNVSAGEILFMGDDIPDLACMRFAGIGACPSDAASEIKDAAIYISPLAGGQGCVRDVIEKVLKLNYKWPLDTEIAST